LAGTDHCTGPCKGGGERVNVHLLALSSLQSTLPNIVSHQNELHPALFYLWRGKIAGCNALERDGEKQ